MKFPHTHFPKGIRVSIRLRDGEIITGKFKERQGRKVVLDGCEVATKYIASIVVFSKQKKRSLSPRVPSSVLNDGDMPQNPAH